VAQRIRLTFLGNVYELKAEESDVDAEAVARYVEKTVASVEKEHRGLPPAKIMVLAALIMGRDFIAAKKELQHLKSTLSEKGTQLISKIEATLGEKS
jgi:cell division protein ZapA (FtsZ GTPase activity inhibitor)